MGIEPGERAAGARAVDPYAGFVLEAPAARFGNDGRRPSRLDNGAPDRPSPSNSVALIDPETDRIAGHVPVGWRPAAVAVGHDSVWVANADDGTVSRIDPGSMTVVRTIGIGSPAIDLEGGA